MRKRIKSIYESHTVAINDWSEDKNLVLGEWTMTTKKFLGIPYSTRTYRRDTTKAVITSKNRLGFKNN